jgi:hypothetical protein
MYWVVSIYSFSRERERDVVQTSSNDQIQRVRRAILFKLNNNNNNDDDDNNNNNNNAALYSLYNVTFLINTSGILNVYKH